MPKLLRSSETMGCGATIKLDSGEVVYVSIAQAGVSVRHWDMSGGFFTTLLSNYFGAKLYYESNVYKNAQTAQALSMIFPDQAPELNFKNPVLAVFSNAIWHCGSAAEVRTVLNEAANRLPELDRWMKWSRFIYCAATVALAELLITNGASPWFTVPLGAFAAWWTFICIRTLWTFSSYHVAGWRLHQAPSLPPLHDLDAPRKVKQWEWLSNPKLDRLVDAVTMVIILGFPVLLWLPLIFWLIR